jgi:PAS domain S-box-containing protein
MRVIKPKLLITAEKNLQQKGQFPDRLHQLAFDNSFLANIISIVSTGKIIAANQAAEKLLGYTAGKGLLSKNLADIFTGSDEAFQRMLKQRETAGHATGDLTALKKNGRSIPCQITSVMFTGDNQIRKSITTLIDRSQGIRRQTEIDHKKEKQVAAEIIFALSKSEAVLNRLHDLEHTLDKEITAKELSLSASLVQQQLFEKEWQAAKKLKDIQIATAVTAAKQLERSDLGKELHDNVNQLLAASIIFMDLASRNEEHRNDHISRSSEYTRTAITEIRKLAKGLVNVAIDNAGLCVAIGKMTHDLMEVYPIKITCKMDDELNTRMSIKFNMDVFRIVQEQLNNIMKHAKASRVSIGLFQKGTDIILSIADNGIGFDTNQIAEGIGIINIKSRAAFYNGNAAFVSKPGKGCILTVRFPVEYSIREIIT